MINFVEVERTVYALKERLATGEIDRSTFEARLLDLIDVAEDGYYWMLGHKTQTWYRHDGKQWVVDNPGELMARLLHKNSFHSNTNPVNESPPEWNSIEWGWFLASLLFLGVITYLVYLSS